jgi:flagellar motor switch protein FliN/FliY
MSEEATEQPSKEEVANEILGDAMRNTKNAAVLGVDVDIVAVLGTADLKISQILQLGRGAVVELDRFVGEPVDIRAERKLVARGEVVVVSDKLAVQITEVVGREES